jgi:hypothetical protein
LVSTIRVVEYGRVSFRDVVDVGRVYWAKGIRPGGSYSFMNVHYTYRHDAAEFEKWYKRVVRWIKQNSRSERSAD